MVKGRQGERVRLVIHLLCSLILYLLKLHIAPEISWHHWRFYTFYGSRF